MRDLWLQGLQLDLIEQGVGDNSVHDVPTSKTMTFDDLLNALVEGRVLVDRNFKSFSSPLLHSHGALKKIEELPARIDLDFIGSKQWDEPLLDKTPKGVPTLERIISILVSHGYAIAQEFGGQGFFVDELQSGHVRVRCGDHHSSKTEDSVTLAQVLSFFRDEYEAVVVAGTGSYAHSADLLIFPRPNIKDYYGYRMENQAHLVVSHAMIRKDVWEALLSGMRWQKMVQSILKHWADHVVSMFRNFSLPSVGIGTHLDLLFRTQKNAPESLIKVLAEFAVIERRLSECRYQWRPSSSAGPQFGEWREHANLLAALQRVARSNAREK
ncbi:MAG: hypothetical protein HZA36_01385 [Parcubacteria group bacterium]|nr:hypothetical protein [Parcubacteria group bacterium]